MEMGIMVEVTGEVVPYAFKNDEGEDVGGLNLRVPGDTVSVALSAENAEKMKIGEVWTVIGRAQVSRSKDRGSKLRIYEPHELTRRKEARNNEAGPTMNFGEAPKPKAARAAGAWVEMAEAPWVVGDWVKHPDRVALNGGPIEGCVSRVGKLRTDVHWETGETTQHLHSVAATFRPRVEDELCVGLRVDVCVRPPLGGTVRGTIASLTRRSVLVRWDSGGARRFSRDQRQIRPVG